jgi:hypothetical protein
MRAASTLSQTLIRCSKLFVFSPAGSTSGDGIDAFCVAGLAMKPSR